MKRCKKCGLFQGIKKHICPTKVWNKGISLSEEIRKKISKSKKGQLPWITGKKHTEESKLKNSLAHKGKKRSLESRRKQGQSIKGEKSYLWKGGITPIHKAIRESFKYEEWRKKVFERDLYTCQHCGEVGGKLNADHIKPFSLYPKLRLELSNGRTLCEKCHDKIGWNLFKENNPRKLKFITK